MPVEPCASGRRAYRRTRFKPAVLAVALSSAFAVPTSGVLAQTLPAGGVAIHGQAVISNPAPKQLKVVTQNGAGTNHSAINWQSFSIGAGNSATFVQPSAASTSINRVVSNTPSVLLGNLSSNGKLVLVNQSGIAVGAGAVIDTAGFTASALRMSDADALAGRLRFGDASALGVGSITVDGRITASNGDVVLIAPNIDVGTSALVKAPNGSTVLAAGQQVEITGRGLEGISLLVQAPGDQVRNLGRLEGNAAGIFAGTLRHSGEIQATAASLEGGTVVLKATGDAYVEGTGKVIATGTKGGSVDVLGNRVALTDNALIDASGSRGGGSIRIGGDFQGKNPDLPNAVKTFLGPDTVLRADATASGDGGRIIVWSDDYTQAHGAISARGGNQGGDGGFVEVSGKRSLAFSALVDTRAPSGLTGTLLLDPDFIDIDGTGAAYSGAVLFGDAPAFLSIAAATINASLSNVVLQANEDINFNVAVSLANPGVSLTARAGGFLNVNGSITTKGGAVSLTAGDAGSLTNPTEGSLNLNQAIDTTGGGAFAAGAPVTLTSNLSDVGGNSIFINANINAGTSAVTLDALVGGPIDLAAGTIIGGDLDLFAAFNVNQTGGSITASGTTTLDASNVSLTRPGNNFNGFGGIANTVSVTDANGIMLGASSFSQLTVNANGNVTQNAAVIVGGTTTINAGTGNVSLTTAGNNLNNLNVSGNALNIVEGAGSALTVLSLSSGLNQPVSLAAGHNLTLPGTAISTGTADLTLISGNTLTIPGALSGNNISLTAVAGLLVNAPITAAGNFDVTVTGVASTMAVNRAVSAGGDMTLNLAGNLSVLASASGLAGLSAAGSQSISAGGNILLQGAGSGSNNRAVIESTDASGIQSVTANGITLLGGADGGGLGTGNYASIRTTGDQTVTVGNGGITMTGGGGSQTGNHATIEQNGGAGTSQSITVNGTGSIIATGGSSAVSGIDPAIGSHAGIGSENGDSQTITFTGTGAGRAITLTGGTVGSDAYAEIFAGVGTQLITGAGLITLTGGASGGGASFGVDDTTGNLAAIGADNNDQTIIASGLVLQGGAAGLNNFAVVYGGGNQSITVGAGGLQLRGGGGGASDAKNAALLFKGSDVPATSQTITVGGGGAIVLQGGNAIASNVGLDANLLNLSNGAFAAIRSEGVAQLIEFTASGGSISMTGGVAGSSNTAFIQAISGSQAIRGSNASNAPAISLTGGASGGVVNEGNRALIGAEVGTQTITASAISTTGGAGGTENLAQIRQGGVTAGLGETQTVSIVGGGNLSIQGGAGSTNLARIQSYGLTQTVNTTGALTLSGGTGAALNFARIEAINGDQFITGSASVTLVGGASGGTTGNGNFADIRQRNVAKVQSVSAGVLVIQGGDAGVENVAALTADGNQIVTANSIALTGGDTGDTNRAGIVSNSGSQSIAVGAGGLSLTGGGGSVTDRRNFASIFQGGLAGTSQNITVAGGGNVTLQAGNSAGTSVGLDNGSLAYITNQGDSQLLEFTGTGSAISVTAGSVGSLNVAGILARNGSQTIRGSIAAHAPSISVTGGSAGVVGEANGSNIGANTGTQTISAKSVTLNGGNGLDSFATITAPNQSIDIDGNLTLQGAGGTGSSPGARIGGRPGAAGSNTVLDLTVSGNLTVTAGALAGAAIGSTSLANGLTNDIDISAGGNLTLTPSAGAGVRIGSRADDVQAGQISIVANAITTNAGDGAGNVAGILTLGNIALTAAGSVTEATDTKIVANLLTVTANGGSIVLDSIANDVNILNATVPFFNTGDILFTNGPGLTLGVSGIAMAGTGRTARVTADDIQITGAVSNIGGTVVLRPLDLARSIRVETTPTAGVLSLSPSELQLVTNASMLEIGRLDGTGNTDVTVGVNDANVLASNLRLLAGNNFTSGPTGGIGAGAGSFSLEIAANNDVAMQGNVNLGDNRTLGIYADEDGSTVGNVNIGAVTLQIGTGVANTTGSMDIKGSEINAGVSGGGSALIEVRGSANQTFTATNGDITLVNSNAATGSLRVQSGTGTQTLNAAGELLLQAGTGTATSTHVSAGGAQTVNALGISLEGGTSGGGFNNGNFALLQAAGNQSLTVGALGIDITGGGGALTDNRAFIWQSGGAGTSQTVTVSGGGGITLQGGSSAGSNVGGFGHGSFASLEGWGDSQTITLSAGAVSLTGGTNGSRALASIYAPNGSQTISGASTITLRGGDSGGIDGEGNGANISANAGTQSISASSISLTGGLGGAENTANFFSGGSQTIAASGLSLIGGAGGGGFDTGNAAFINTNGSQTITVGAGGLQLTGGGGPLTDNAARVLQLGTTGTSQTITVNGGGSITLVGGSSADVDVGGTGHGSRVLIEANGTAQNITFSIAGSGAINLTGGSAGSRAFAQISSVNGSQTITGPGAINITGGAAGGFAGEGNNAGITAALGLQSITAGTATLTGGATGIENSAFITAPTQVLDFGGNVSLAGSAGGDTNSGARIGGPGTIGNTNTTLDVTGNLTLAAGTNSGVAIGSSGNGTGLTNTITVTVSGDVLLTPSAAQGVRIGSPAADIQTGAISVAAGGNILFNGSGSIGRASMRSLGNVSLSAGSAITQSSEAIVTANQLSASSGGNTSLAGANQVNSFSASSTSGNISFNNAQSLSVGAVTTGAGAQTVSIGTVGGSSSLTVGASTTDDNWNLVSGGALSLTGAFSGNNLSLTSGAALTVGQNLAAAGSLDLITPNGNAITQVAGNITVGGLTTINAGAGDVTLTSTGNDFNQIGVSSGGTVRLRDANAVVLNNTTVAGLVLENAGNIVLDGTITATAVGDAVALASTAGILDSQTGTISTPNGRWLVYLATPVGSDLSGLSADFRQYNAVLGSAILGSGDGLLFGLAPTITAALSGGPASKVYDASTSIDVSDPSILALAVGVQAGDTVTLSKVGGGVLDDKNIGSNKNISLGVQVASATDAGGKTIFGYTFLSTGTTSGTANGPVGNVTAASLTASGLVANNKVYDATTVATLGGTGSVVGLGSDNVSIAGTAAGSFADKNVGTAKPVSVTGLTLAGTDAGNYTLVPPSGLTADISVANLAVTGLSANNKTYDATTAAILSGSAGVAALGSDTLALGGTPSATFADKNVGNAKPVSVGGFTLGGTDAVNYSLVQPVLSANITPASISSITGITAASKVYDATTAATLNTGGAGFVGLLGTDILTLTGASGVFIDKNVGSPKTVTISGLALSGADAGNYTLASPSTTTTASITAASISAVSGISANNKVYDGTTFAGLNTSGAGFVGILGSDSLSVSGVTGAFANKNAGSAKLVNISGISLGGADASNYVLANATATATADISQANLSVTGGITAANRAYDGTTSASLNASGATFSGVLGSDNVLGLGASGNFANKNVGVAKPVAVSAVSLGGTDGANYLVSAIAVTPSADVTPAVISAVTGITASKTYDGSTSISLSDATASFAGMVPGDNLLASGVGSFADKKVDTGKALTVSALNLGGTDAGNYTLGASSGSGTITITPLALATWVGGGGNQLWSNPQNWSNGSTLGAVPDGSNVLAVSIPANAGTIDMNVADVTLQKISSASLIDQGSSGSGGFTTDRLDLVTQGGIKLASSANRIGKLSASNSVSGDIVVVNGVALELQAAPGSVEKISMDNSVGNISVTNTGAITTTGLVRAVGTLSITANSPLTIGSPGVQAGGNITLVASNLTSAGNLVLNGDVRSELGSVKLDAGNNLEQYGAVFGALGVTADAGGGRTFGSLATSSKAPVIYRVKGIVVDPPPESLGASTPILQETAKQVDVLVTFLDLFEKAVESQQTEETNPDGTKKKKDSEAIVTEGEVCK